MSTLGCYNYIRNQAQMAVDHEKDLIRKVCCFHGIHDQAEIERTIEHFVDTTLLKRCLKPKKDLNAPKRNLSSYMLFSASIRDEVTKANPGLDMGAMSKLIGEKWATAGDEVKAEFQKKAEADKRAAAQAEKEAAGNGRLPTEVVRAGREPDGRRGEQQCGVSGREALMDIPSVHV